MNFFLQVETATTAEATSAFADAAANPKTISIMDLAIKGGWIMIPLLLMSMLAIYIFVERMMTIRKAGKEDANFMNNIRDCILNGKIDAAITLCKSTDSPIARMIEKGISRIGRPLQDISASIENTGKLEVYRLERSVALLATVAGAGPMLGFLGTVLGMIKAFFNMANSDQGVVISALAGGIYEAMVTTVAGLVVGILAFVFYNLLVASIEKVVYKMEARSIEFLDLLNEPS
ncbi:MAG: MotA/TolQ/ExbB proton channel family protein [Bacteroidetes bacterium]|nr:MotA/TolQ/ExbB proton channel family protein [Bacteroidota bacterium]